LAVVGQAGAVRAFDLLLRAAPQIRQAIPQAIVIAGPALG